LLVYVYRQNDFVDGLARIYFNTSDINPAAFRFNAGQDHTDMKKRITSQLRECGRGLFAADASVILDHFDFMETALEDGVSFIELGTWPDAPPHHPSRLAHTARHTHTHQKMVSGSTQTTRRSL
jgi:hypothetical protein